MKRFLICFFVLLLFSCSVASAAPNPASFLYGTWARIVEYDSGDLYVDMFHVFPDHRAWYFSTWVSGSDIDPSPESILQWSFEDGKFYLFFENGNEVFIPKDDYTLQEGAFYYKKIYPRRDL